MCLGHWHLLFARAAGHVCDLGAALLAVVAPAPLGGHFEIEVRFFARRSHTALTADDIRPVICHGAMPSALQRRATQNGVPGPFR